MWPTAHWELHLESLLVACLLHHHHHYHHHCRHSLLIQGPVFAVCEVMGVQHGGLLACLDVAACLHPWQVMTLCVLHHAADELADCHCEAWCVCVLYGTV